MEHALKEGRKEFTLSYRLPLPLSQPRREVEHPREVFDEVISWVPIIGRVLHKPVNVCDSRIVYRQNGRDIVDDG